MKSKATFRQYQDALIHAGLCDEWEDTTGRVSPFEPLYGKYQVCGF